MANVREITFEQVIKNKFGNLFGETLLGRLETHITAGLKGHALKKELIKDIALTGSEDEALEQQKIQAATSLDGYWVWIVFGIPSGESL